MRAVLDPNVLVSALVSPRGTPASIAARWRGGRFELIVSEKLLRKLETALGYPKLHKRVAPDEAAAFVTLLRQNSRMEPDPTTALRRSRDAADDYLIALAESTQAVLVSGDRDLLDLSHELPIRSPRLFLAMLD